MANFLKCGAYDSGSGACDLVVNEITGEVVLMSDLLGNCYVSEITVLDPITPASTEAAMKVARHFDADGVILSAKNLITLKGNTATYHDLLNHDKIDAVVEFDTDVQCEEPITTGDDID